PVLLRETPTMPKPRTCEKCGSGALKRRSTTYPLMLPGRQINVARVQLHECADCGNLTPTAAGQAKLQRCLAAVGAMLENLPK
ncbi:MAG: hypothetical protein WBW93_18390, partial [Steroidobacteraceae bacterium]